jgi:hypothetical protein
MNRTLTHLVAIAFFVVCGVTLLAQGRNRGAAEVTLAGKKISIDYGKPALEGRDMVSLAKPGTVWRIGMNQATEITSEHALMVGGKRLGAGKYSLWARKTGENSWMLAFHPRTGISGLPEMRDGFVAETPLKSESSAERAELLKISLNSTGKDINIEIHWGTSKLLGTFQAM